MFFFVRNWQCHNLIGAGCVTDCCIHFHYLQCFSCDTVPAIVRQSIINYYNCIGNQIKLDRFKRTLDERNTINCHRLFAVFNAAEAQLPCAAFCGPVLLRVLNRTKIQLVGWCRIGAGAMQDRHNIGKGSGKVLLHSDILDRCKCIRVGGNVDQHKSCVRITIMINAGFGHKNTVISK